ncbi:MAG TPA: hypothetical protein DEP36_14890, partial [Gammaproteobacteria bacterium]|nr:hypothetical protein [Gammaproteobacteria bacterium]
MKIKRLCAANIREAMRKIREELGPDAVILSNQRTAAGFEIVAAIDYDEQTLQQATLEAAAQRRALAREIEEQSGRDPENDKPSTAPADQLFDPAIQQATAAPESDQLATCTSQEQAAPARLNKSRVVWAQDPLLVEMRNEIQVMHNLLEQQLSGLAWG